MWMSLCRSANGRCGDEISDSICCLQGPTVAVATAKKALLLSYPDAGQSLNLTALFALTHSHSMSGISANCPPPGWPSSGLDAAIEFSRENQCDVPERG
jgi:hypothetical protein